ncbi:ABC transporter substrate-binding protein [Paenibacillus vulneris]|uniref:ABC transporter substrate-binding protein n=1 Tax=Paenibacillus vulneris TaxID=1133364 RepID=A0ABW3URQ8_9BACL|nr:ABC transporter substrate-binding protein [Paenibacillus sp. 32352]
MNRFKMVTLPMSIILLSSLLLNACSDSTKNSNDSGSTDGPSAKNGKVTLTYWNLFAGGDGENMNEMVKKFNEENKDKIEVKALTQDWGQYYTKLQTAVAGGVAPDIGISHTSKLSELVTLGIIEPMDDYAKAGSVDWSGYNQNILNATVFDGKHYALPLDAHPFILYYNKKILKDMNLLSDDGKPKMEPGADGFTGLLSKVKQNAPQGVYPMLLSSSGEDPYRMWWAFYNQLNGPGLLDASGKKAVFNNEQGKKAAEYTLNFFNSGLVPKNFQDIGKAFQAGKAALMPSGVWFTSTLEATQGLEFGAIPLPQFFNKSATWIDSHTLVIPVQKKNKDPKKIEAAMSFAKWIADHGAMWAKAGHIPASNAAVQSQEFKSMPLRSDYLKAASDGVYLPNSPKMWPAKDQLVQALDAIWAGKEPVDKGLEKAVQSVEKILSQP